MDCPSCAEFSSCKQREPQFPDCISIVRKRDIDMDWKVWFYNDYQPEFYKWKTHRCVDKKKTHKGNGAPTGAFAFTLTKSPTDNLTEDDMVKAVKKIMSQKSCLVKKYAWYLEHKEGGKHPHIHGMYETESGGRIECKHFARAWPIWGEAEAKRDPKLRFGSGFRGGYHRPVRSDEAYSAYIAKDGGLSDSFNV